MDKDTDSSSYDTEEEKSKLQLPKPKMKKRRYEQKYNPLWEKQYKWLTKSDKDATHFYCKSCKNNYVGGVTEIMLHEFSKKHKASCAALQRQRTVLDMMPCANNFQKKVKEGEIRIAAFVAEHNLPFTVANHLPALVKAICPDSKIAESISCARTKCSGIVKNVIGAVNNEKLWDDIRINKFSLIVDESTDKGCTKHLALVVRLKQNNLTKDEFLTLLPIIDGTANTLFNSIMDELVKHNIPYKDNLVGFASDGANVMMGANHSLSTLLCNQIPNLFILKCICHSFALCASYACKKLPDGIECLVREIFKFFQYSSKKFGEYKEAQLFCNVKPHRLLHPSQTRWLSLNAVVSRVLEQWNALKLFFTSEKEKNNTESVELIFNKLHNIFNKLYLEFLDFILPYLTDLIKEMQAEKPKIYLLYSRVESVYKSILEIFIKKNYLEKTALHEIKYKDPYNLLPLEEIYLGGAVTGYISSHQDIPKTELNKFRVTCLAFYQEVLDQIRIRFPFNRKDLKYMNAIIPENILKRKTPSLVPLAAEFPNVIKSSQFNDLDREWRLLPNIDLHLDDKSKIDFEDLWNNISSLKTGLDEPMFPLVLKIVNHIMILPHSSANVERVFSAINLNKTKQRNRLSTSTLIGVLHTKRMFSKNIACYNCCIENKMTENMQTKTLYDHKKKYTSSSEENDT